MRVCVVTPVEDRVRLPSCTHDNDLDSLFGKEGGPETTKVV